MMTGKVISVETRNLGEPATAAASIGATVLSVNDASTFEDTGGLATVGDAVLPYTSADVDANTITLAAALTVAVEEQDPIEVYPPTPIKTALVEVGDEGSEPIPATVPHYLLDRLTDGTRDDTTAESVTLEQRGTYEYVITDLVAEQLYQQTLDYVEAEVGIGLSDAVAQVQDLNALGQVASPVVSADSILLAGSDLQGQLDQGSRGKVLSARLAGQASNISITGTSTKIFELNCGTVKAGRTYRIVTQMLSQNSGTLAMTDRIIFVYRYTVDGTAPTTSSTSMDDGFNDNYFGGNTSIVMKPEAEVAITSDAVLRIGVFTQTLGAPAGAYAIYALSASPRSRPIMTLYDDGPSGARQDSAITLTGGGTSRFVKTYNASWAFGVDVYGAQALDAFCYVGSENDYCGFVGFDSASMVAQLAGAATPVSCVLRWYTRTRATSAGLDLKLATHNHSSSTAASAATGGFPSFAYANLTGYGLTLLSNVRNNTAPGSVYEESLGTTVFNQFKAGSRKGVGFLGTPEASTSGGNGSVYGDGAYQAQLIFTYDGTS